jgi:hypothetical protein
MLGLERVITIIIIIIIIVLVVVVVVNYKNPLFTMAVGLQPLRGTIKLSIGSARIQEWLKNSLTV